MHVLFVIPGYYGHITPTYSLVKALIKAGHKVTYSCSDEIFKITLESFGATFLKIEKFQNTTLKAERQVEETTLTNEEFLSSLIESKYTEIYLETCEKYYESDGEEAKYFFEVTKDGNYDLIIGDKLYNLGMLLAEALKVPFIQSDYHIFHTHKYEYDIARLSSLPYKFKERINVECIKKYNDFLKTCNELPIKPTINDIDSYIEEYVNPRNYVIIYAPELFFQIPEGDNISLNSYLFLGNRYEKYNMVPEEDASKTLSNIFVSLGTIMNLRITTFKNIMAVLGESKYHVTISTGGSKTVYEELNVSNIYTNIVLELFVNQTEILQKSDLFITHGGANSIYESVYHAVPMILIPNGGDQFENSKVIETRQLGKALSATKKNFKQELNATLKHIEENFLIYSNNAKDVSDQCLSSANAETIVYKIENLFETKFHNSLISFEKNSNQYMIEFFDWF